MTFDETRTPLMGFLPPCWRDPRYPLQGEQIVRNLAGQGAWACMILDDLRDERLRALAAAVQAAGMRVILGWTARPGHVTERCLREAMEITDHLALANTALREWHGTPDDARACRKLADRLGFRWVCTLTHARICRDLAGRAVREALGDTLCVSLCGYVLSGYVYGDPRIPHQGRQPEPANSHLLALRNWTSLAGRNLREIYGLTAESLADYLGPMNCHCGAGGAQGLAAGSAVYARRVGFKGVCSGFPIIADLMDQAPVFDAPHPDPGLCGDPAVWLRAVNPERSRA